ncbi:LPS export ABC transporter permease LptG [bacterium]|nr:LPS export ABC transporter permease LptG [Candidatus Neomarinimicrobiota bacterium]MCK5686282.1 LPS export ABC transporter permease LptG [bacterium]
MSRLDRYLLAKFISLYLFIILVFIAIFFIVDVVEHIDNFIDNGMSMKSIAFYYLYTLPFFIHIALPMSALLAVVFHFGLLNKRSELTAMKSAGISLYRIVAPFLLAGIVLSIISFIFEDRVVVPANQILSEFKKENMQRRRYKKQYLIKDLDINIKNESILHIDEYNTESRKGKGVGIQILADSELRERYDAKKIVWKNEQWVLYDGQSRKFSNKIEVYSTFDSLHFQWDIQPEDLEKRKVSPENMSFAQLIHFVERLSESGLETRKWKVKLWFKTAMNFTVFIVILFGIPLVSYQSRSGNFASGVGLSIFIIFIYTTALKFGETLGYGGQLSPFLSVWIPNFIFFSMGIILLLRVQK